MKSVHQNTDAGHMGQARGLPFRAGGCHPIDVTDAPQWNEWSSQTMPNKNDGLFLRPIRCSARSRLPGNGSCGIMVRGEGGLRHTGSHFPG
jgi:hypothetical protein